MRLSVGVEEYYRYKAPKTLELIEASSTHWRTLCPFCSHVNEKFYIDKKTGLYHCFHCDVGGTLVKYHALLKGISIDDAAKELGDAREIKPEVAVISDLYVDKLHKDLLDNFVALDQLKTSWYVDDAIIEKYRIGLKDNLVCVPIFNKRGDCVNIRYKKLWRQPGEKSNTWSHVDTERPNVKFGAARLYPISTVVSDAVVFLCAGEKDCLSSIRMGLVNSITATGGEGTFKEDFAFELAGKKVYIIYDADSAGLYDAKKVYDALKNIADVEVVNLPKMEPYEDGSPRKDITDYWKLGKTLADFYEECKVSERWKEQFREVPQQLRPAEKTYTSLMVDSDMELLKGLAPNFVDRYCDISQQLINSPASYHRLCGLWLVSNLLGRNCGFIDGVSNIYPNLWILILGSTTKFHKSTTMEFAKDLLVKVDEDAIASTAFTPQGFWKRLKDRQGSCLTSAIYYDEVAGMFDQMRADYNAGAKENLIRLYDGQTVRYDRSKDSINIDTSYVTFLGGGIPSRMAELLSWRDIELGFLGRFLVSLERNPNDYTPRTQIDYETAFKLKRLVEEAAQIRTRWSELWKILLRHNEENQPEYLFPNELDEEEKRYQFYLTPEAQKRFDQFEQLVAYSDEVNEHPHIAAVHARLPSLCKKIATIYAASDRVNSFGPVVDIGLEYVVLAIRDMDCYRNHMVDLARNVGITEIEKQIISIFELVYKNPRIDRRAIAKSVSVSKKELTAMLETMIDRGLLREHKLSETNSEFLIGL